MPAIPQWNEEAHLELMQKLSITKSIVSITSPSTHLTPGDDASARHLTRAYNDFAANLASRRPAQFGFWATLPLPDVTGSLAEIAYALDSLHADGIALETNHQGRYLGDAAFDAVFAELERRKATVFLHPTGPCIAHSDGPQAAAPMSQYPSPMFEFFFDTARAVINLFLSGTVARCPNVTFILSHGAGALPPIVERFTSFATSVLGLEVKINSDVVKETMRRQFYLDLAGVVFPDHIHGVLRYVGPDRLLYGSDYPYTPAKAVEMLAGRVEEVFPEEGTKRAVLVGNAQRLLAKGKVVTEVHNRL
ncbi:MAG: 2-amino-3-carboxymuconate-6-semialdehyde decarboxylase [Lasallia pustulata]|uniref:6-methylsalicylate decarboxylase n=1 Tax=Lasallia pustulata TaxID=136370 RepID=A0A5M8PNM2_9LECA|nr:MAG: 2-amino-3-carboxymuconate-6-semialdehyde decarboxylase [Lasallia pustulata]